jgi:hypothetical protein
VGPHSADIGLKRVGLKKLGLKKLGLRGRLTFAVFTDFLPFNCSKFLAINIYRVHLSNNIIIYGHFNFIRELSCAELTLKKGVSCHFQVHVIAYIECIECSL